MAAGSKGAAGAGGRRREGGDGARRTVVAAGFPSRAIDLLRAQVGGQEDAEDGAVARGVDGRAELHFAAAALEDGAGDPEAEAGAALAFGGKEGLAETALHIGRDATAVIADGEAEAAHAGVGPAAGGAQAQAQLAVGQ